MPSKLKSLSQESPNILGIEAIISCKNKGYTSSDIVIMWAFFLTGEKQEKMLLSSKLFSRNQTLEILVWTALELNKGMFSNITSKSAGTMCVSLFIKWPSDSYQT